MPDTAFYNGLDFLSQLARRRTRPCPPGGASAAETELSEGFGQSVTVRRGEVETIEYNRDKGVDVTVYIGQQRGHASTSDFSSQAIRETVEAALSIAALHGQGRLRGTCRRRPAGAGLPDLDLFHPWDLPVEQASRWHVRARLLRSRSTRASPIPKAPRFRRSSRISSTGTPWFHGRFSGSRHSAHVLGDRGRGRRMQRDDWYTMARAAEIWNRRSGGADRGRARVRRLGARKIETMEVPVLFEAPVASGLLGHFVGAVSGGSLYRKSSFLLDSLGQRYSRRWPRSDVPDMRRGLASSPFDDEGVATKRRRSSRTACCKAISSAVIRRASWHAFDR